MKCQETYKFFLNGQVVDEKSINVGTPIDPGDNPWDCFDIPEEVEPECTEEGYAGADKKGNTYEVLLVK